MEVTPKELEINKLKNEIAKLTSQVSNLGQKLTQSERERIKLVKDLEGLEKKYEVFCANAYERLRKADERAEKAESKQHEWQIEARTIADELAQCKDELFGLQPRNEVTDTHVATLWDTLCQQIIRWVDDEAEFASELIPRLKELQSHNQLSDLVIKYWGPDRQIIVRNHKMTDDLDCLLRYNIHCLLENYVFDESIYFFGLKETDKYLLQLIETSMGSLKPPRGMPETEF
jgi:DNA repair exonuclease SbcCD ATPase subunit